MKLQFWLHIYNFFFQQLWHACFLKGHVALIEEKVPRFGQGHLDTTFSISLKRKNWEIWTSERRAEPKSKMSDFGPTHRPGLVGRKVGPKNLSDRPIRPGPIGPDGRNFGPDRLGLPFTNLDIIFCLNYFFWP